LTEPTVEQTWKKYLEMMTWHGFPNLVNEHKRQAARFERRIKNATPAERQAMFDRFERHCMQKMQEKLTANL